MAGTGEKVLVTTVPQAAKGGIAALHKLFRESRSGLNLRFATIGSAAPFSECTGRRCLRLVRQYCAFLYALARDPEIGVVHVNTAPDQRALRRDIVLVHLAKLFGKKVVLQVHGAFGNYQISKGVMATVTRAFSLSDRVLVFSHHDRLKIERALGSGDRVMIFPNAVRVDDFRGSHENLRERFSIPEANKVVLFVARLVRDKGIYEIFDAIPSIVDKFSKVTFLFAGDGPEMERMKAECSSRKLEKWVLLAGNLQYDDVIRAFNTADILVLPSYSEGMPMSILQALAAGVSIVSTPVGAIPEFLRDRKNCFLVSPRSHAELAEKTLLLLKDDSLRRRMGAANAELAEREFDADIVLNRLGAIYASL